MGSAAGLPDAKIRALDADHYAASPHFGEPERAALAYADAITRSDHDVDDALFAGLQQHFTANAIIELTATIAWENASSKFNRALRVPAKTCGDPRTLKASVAVPSGACSSAGISRLVGIARRL